LSLNKLEEVGIEQLGAGLAKNEGLRLLDLSSCHIKGQASVFLVKSLRSNFTLNHINLKDNSVKDVAGELLSDLTRVNKNFLNVNLDLNPLNLKFVANIKANLKENAKLFRKGVVPRIRNEIEKIKAPLETFESKNEKIRMKLQEKMVNQQRYEILDESFEEIKEKEMKKTQVMVEEHRVLKCKNQDLSRIIDGNKEEVMVNDR
jgi:hypothetical protein